MFKPLTHAKSQYWVLVLIGFMGFISSQIGSGLLATFCLCYVFYFLYKVLEFKYEGLTAIALVFVLLISESSALYMIGQYVGTFPESLFNSIVYFTNVYLCCFLQNQFKMPNGKLFKLPPVIIAMFLKVLYLLPVSKVIDFLGFGYDNYGHLSVIRKLLIEGKFFYAEKAPSGIPAFAANSPIGIHALFAFVMQATGLSGDKYDDFLKYYLFLFLLLISVFVFVAYKLATYKVAPYLNRLFALFLVITCLLYAYPSHIWVSGYFASNIATLQLLIAIGVVNSKENMVLRVWLLAALTGISIYVYSIFAVLIIVPFVIFALFNLGSISRQFKEINWTYRWLLISSQMYFLFLAFVTVYALIEGYGSGHFLVSGGIQPIPFGTTMFIFGMAFALMSGKGSLKDQIDFGFVSLGVIICISCISMLYAYRKLNIPGEQWFLPYYPTKLSIAVLILAIIYLIRYFVSGNLSSEHTKFVGYLTKSAILVSLIAIILGTGNEWPFNSGFMGSTRGVIESIRHANDEVVDGESVQIALEYAQKLQKPVLYLSDLHESELNTRWINSTLFEWTDENWGKWMSARSAIDQGDFAKASDLINGRFILMVDNYSNFRSNPIPFKVFNDICVIDLIRSNTCRSSNNS